jgi:hypothetical protein
MLGFNAMAMAPTVGEIPDIIVGDAEEATESNRFVFPDAINLDSYVSDDNTSPGGIIWSYGVAVTPTRYTLDSVQPLDIGSEDPNAPGSKRIDTQDLDPGQADSNARSITIRDELRSPVATDPGPYADPAGTGILPDSRVVMLYASDGTTWTMGTFVIYTEDDGLDRFSPAEPPPIYQADFTTGPNNWTYAQNLGSATGTQSGTTGLCIDVPATGENDGVWFSPYGIVELVDNAVYRARLSMTTTQTTVFQTPLWAMIYDNIGNDVGGTPRGTNNYGGETFVLDNEGGANSPISGTGRSTFDFYLAPTPFQVAHFRDTTNGFFNPVLDADNDMRLQVRVIDSDAAQINAQIDQGAVCMGSIAVTQFDFDDRTEVQQVFHVDSSTPFVNADQSAGQPGSFAWDNIHTGGDGSTFSISSGVITITPTSTGGWDNANVMLLRPGDRTVNLGTTDGSENVDNWPVPWVGDTLYMIEYGLSAPTATDAENSPDVIRLGADVLDQQIVQDNFIASNTPDLSGGAAITRGITMPRSGSPQTYTCFWYSLSESLTNIPDALRWRPRFEILTSPDLNPIGRTTNTGAISVHSVTVTEITF